MKFNLIEAFSAVLHPNSLVLLWIGDLSASETVG